MLIIYLYCIKKKHISDVFFTFVEIYGLYVKKLIIISQLINTNMNNKITLLLISLLMSIVCFSSCSDDDDSDSILSVILEGGVMHKIFIKTRRLVNNNQ